MSKILFCLLISFAICLQNKLFAILLIGEYIDIIFDKVKVLIISICSISLSLANSFDAIFLYD